MEDGKQGKFNIGDYSVTQRSLVFYLNQSLKNIFL
uniref:Uncharacterized protein n=1 Tax=Anguilla anguilla TaxID=7936 RepID=A0A0E9QRB0_ANGAN